MSRSAVKGWAAGRDGERTESPSRPGRRDALMELLLTRAYRDGGEVGGERHVVFERSAVEAEQGS
jgi:hypothetical protein